MSLYVGHIFQTRQIIPTITMHSEESIASFKTVKDKNVEPGWTARLNPTGGTAFIKIGFAVKGLRSKLKNR